MSNFYSRALAQSGSSHMVHLKPTEVTDAYLDQVKDANGKSFLIQKAANQVILQSDCLVAVNPQTTVPSTLLNGGIVEYTISKDQISKLDSAHLKLAITNGTGSACTLAPAKALIQRLEIFADQGGSVIFTEDYLHLWLENQFMKSEQWNSYATIGNSSTSYGVAGTSIADNGTATYYIPIYSFLDAGNLHLAGLTSDIMIRFTFQPSTYTVQTGSAPTVTAAQLLLRGVYEPPFIAERKRNQYANVPLLIKFLDCQQNTTTLTMAASSTYSINLPSISGLVAYLWVMIRAAARTASNQLTFTQTGNLSSVDVQTAEGESMLGFYPRSPEELMKIIYPEMHENAFNLNTGALFIPFCVDPCSSFVNGNGTGFQSFSGFEKLVINTNSSFTGASYEILVYARVYNSVKIERGRLFKVGS